MKEEMKIEMKPTRAGFGKALDEYGKDERIVCLGCDISDSILISDFYKAHPERKNRFISVGIAEQNATTIAAGLAKEGKIPVVGTYAVFSAGRALDQIRTSVCYGNLNAKIVGAHGGISVGPDGATHQALEDLAQMTALPNMHVFAPCDYFESYKATKAMLFAVDGPCYIRLTREATPVVTNENAPFEFGTANIIKFIGERPNFADAFEIKTSKDHFFDYESITMITYGPMVPEAMRASWILKKEHNLNSIVIDTHSLKPIDKRAIINAAKNGYVIATIEEHQVGTLSGLVSRIILQSGNNPIRFSEIGIPDRFGESGQPWQLIKEFGLSAEHIAKRLKSLYNKRIY